MNEDTLNDAASSIASDLVPASEVVEHEAPEHEEVVQETPVEEVKPPREAPKSWAKEKHEVWTKLPAEAQDQIELREKQMLEGLEQYKGDAGLGRVMREVVTPYKALLAAQGVDEPKAVQYLLNAHYKLSTLPQSQRAAYFAEVAKTYGIDPSQFPAATEVDPQVKALRDEIESLKAQVGQTSTHQFEAAKERITQEVTAFADAKDAQGNKLHPYFDEVSSDIIALIKTGLSLQDAHDKAVWANPVTRQKEIVRLQQEKTAKTREKATQEAEAARRASAANVRSRDTRRTPTEPMGKMEDTLKSTLSEIKSRVH